MRRRPVTLAALSYPAFDGEPRHLLKVVKVRAEQGETMTQCCGANADIHRSNMEILRRQGLGTKQHRIVEGQHRHLGVLLKNLLEPVISVDELPSFFRACA